MEKMEDLRDLLRHEIQDLVSVEDQIIEAMPAMIEKADNRLLKKALSEHLRVTKAQRKRLDKVQRLLGKEPKKEGGLFSRLFSSGETCKGMEGIIREGKKIMDEDMNPEVMDAAIIGAAQRIEHYEICGYGTARAYARELQLTEIAGLLEQTLNEEYAADDRLTEMAVGRLNEKAENARKVSTPASAPKRVVTTHKTGGRTTAGSGNRSVKKRATSKTTTKSSAGSVTKSASKKLVGKAAGKSGGRRTATVRKSR